MLQFDLIGANQIWEQHSKEQQTLVKIKVNRWRKKKKKRENGWSDLVFFWQNHTVIRHNDFHSRITIKLKIRANQLHLYQIPKPSLDCDYYRGLADQKQKASFSKGLMSLALVKLFRIDSHHCSPFQRSALSEQGSSVEHGGPNYEKQQIPRGKGWKRKGKKTVPYVIGLSLGPGQSI